MRPLADWSVADRAPILGVLTDIDDTLTTHARPGPEALAAIARLRAAGLPVIALTGRAVGWSEAAARDWGLTALAAENGAVALWRDGRRLRRAHAQPAAHRRAHAARRAAAWRAVQAALPHARLARDSAGRDTDLAIDHAENARLSAADVDRAAHLLRAAGLRVTVSSIHLNAWLGTHDKLTGARWLVRHRLGRDLDAEADRWVFVGDSANDAVMFAHLRHTVAVANGAAALGGLPRPPAYRTAAARGSGFAEVAEALLAARRRP